MTDLIQTYGLDIIGVVFTALAALFARLLVNHVWLAAMLGRLVVEAKAVVMEVEQTYVDQITAGRADGVLTAEEKTTARAMAIASLKSNLGIKGLRRLGRILGLTDAELDRLLGTHVEAAVKQLALTKGATQ